MNAGVEIELTIIDANLGHVAGLRVVEDACFSQPWPDNLLRDHITGPNRVLLVALSGDRVVGYIGLIHVLDEGHISNIAVLPEYRRRGLGSALLKAVLTRAEKLGLARIYLEVRASNDAARAMYEKYGFSADGRRLRYYEEPVEDAILMTKILGE